jgi:hypothetical protein
MSIPSGDTPQKVQEIYLYLQGHQVPKEPASSWHIDWTSLAWMWGFVAALVALLLLWIKQYRTTRQKTGISPLDSWAGQTTEAAGPATLFFLFLTIGIVAFVAVIVIGHLVAGQKY